MSRTSGGVFVGGVVSEALDEALDGDGLTDSLESLSASTTRPLTCSTHTHQHLVTIIAADTDSPDRHCCCVLHSLPVSV